MLAADKLQLQSALKQQATALKEKEFNLHHTNLMTVGTQAAVLAGLDITMFIEFNPPSYDEWEPELVYVARFIKFLYYITIVAAFCANIFVVSQTTLLSVLGAGLALRGPDGSMMTATDGLYDERRLVFRVFGYGLACTLGSVLLCVWLLLHWEAALVCMAIAIFTCRQVYFSYIRVVKRFHFNEDETVDFHDIFDGPANISVSSLHGNNKRNLPKHSHSYSEISDNHLSSSSMLVPLAPISPRQGKQSLGFDNDNNRNNPQRIRKFMNGHHNHDSTPRSPRPSYKGGDEEIQLQQHMNNSEVKRRPVTVPVV